VEAGKIRKVIALLTDFGAGSCFVGIMKGVIRGICPCEVIDLSHTVSPGNIEEAAFILKKSHQFFPRNTVFVVVVDPGVGTERRIISAEKDGRTFIAPDNGVLSWIISDKEPAYEVSEEAFFIKPVSRTFHGRDIFAPCAALICRGLPLSLLGRRVKNIKKIPPPVVKSEKNRIIGEIILKDTFGNLITSIEEENLKGKAVRKIVIEDCGVEIQGLSSSFEEAKGKPLGAVIDSFGNLEIFAYLRPASSIIKDWYKKKVTVELE